MSRRIPVAFSVLILLGGLWTAAARADRSEPAEKDKPPEEDVYALHKLLVDTLDQVERHYVRDVSRRELIEAAIRGVLAELDPHSNYIDPDDMDRFRSSVESQFGGIGVQVTSDRGQLTVSSPLAGTPAYRAGLMAGDRIVEIDGQSTAKLNLSEAVRLVKGPEGTDVTLTIIHPGRRGEEPEKITITREVIRVKTVLGERYKADGSWDFMLDEQQGIGYIRLTAFSRGTADELRSALKELTQAGLRGLILDVRFNPGGLLRSAIAVSDMFVSSGLIVSTKGRTSPEQTWKARKRSTFENFPMAVLVNQHSASASEIVSACLQDHGRAVIMGERTWGKGSVQNVIEMENRKSAIKLTTAGFYRPSGKNINRAPGAKEDEEWGVTPDEGYVLKLSDRQLRAFFLDRRRRDVLPAKGQLRTDTETPEANDQQSPAESGESDSPDPAEAPDDEAGETEEQKEPPETEEQKEPPETEEQKEPGFVDPQLEMAVDYLKTELARSD